MLFQSSAKKWGNASFFVVVFIFIILKEYVISDIILVFNNAGSNKRAQLELLNVELFVQRVLVLLRHVQES